MVWKFFGRKGSVAVEATLAPESAEAVDDGSYEEPIVKMSLQSTKADIEDLIKAILGNGIHFAIAYAHLQGFKHNLVDNELETTEFEYFISLDPQFTPENVEFAVDRFIVMKENWYLPGPTGDYFIYEINHGRHNDDRNRFEALRSKIQRHGMRDAMQMLGFDLGDFLKSHTADLRKKDLSLIYKTFEDKKQALLPLLLRAEARSYDKYGEYDAGPFVEELMDFCNRFLPKEKLAFFFSYFPTGFAFHIVQDWMKGAKVDDEIPEDGVDFEHWCADRIREQGWHATVSKASGDQGVDVVATKDDLVVAVQCKRYSTPVGNKAVQEAFAGMKHYGADVGVVVATGGFTRSAIELASTVGVILIDGESLGSFTELVLAASR